MFLVLVFLNNISLNFVSKKRERKRESSECHLEGRIKRIKLNSVGARVDKSIRGKSSFG